MTESTGIDLPGEAPPCTHAYEDMVPADLAVESFGQNFAITAVHMITAASAIANGGYLVQPHVVDRILDSDGNIVSTADTSYRRQVISEETSRAIIDILQYNAESGSATGGYVAGYRIAGKTGTTEKIADWNAAIPMSRHTSPPTAASPRRRTPSTPCWCSSTSLIGRKTG